VAQALSSHAADELLQNNRARSNSDTPQEVQNVPGAHDWDATKEIPKIAMTKRNNPRHGDLIAAMTSLTDSQTVKSVSVADTKQATTTN
jgi:hypothetical protein